MKTICGRRVGLGLVLAWALTGCMFGDEPVLTAQTGVAANFSDCVPRECFYGCCQGPQAQPPPQLMGPKELWAARCDKLKATHSAYREYVQLMDSEFNLCDNEGGYEWGPCTPIEAKYVQKVGPNGEPVSAGLAFNECPPSGDWMACPIDEIEISPKEQP